MQLSHLLLLLQQTELLLVWAVARAYWQDAHPPFDSWTSFSISMYGLHVIVARSGLVLDWEFDPE